MAYKKYIKKNGNIYGPYIYHSKRVDGKVVTEYKGTDKFDFNRVLPFVAIFLAILVALFAGYVFINNHGENITGFSVLSLDASHESGKTLQGNLKILLREGELIPASSKIIFTSENNSYNYSLEDSLSDESLEEGSFFIQGSNITGEGIGYGLKGNKEISPKVSFILLISELDKSNESNESEEVFIEREVKGNVSKDKSFEYALRESESVELKPLSVNLNGEVVSEEVIRLEVLNNTVIIFTNYSVEEEGFGKDFLGNETKEFLFDLKNFSLNLTGENLSVKLKYLDKQMASLETELKNGSIQGEAKRPSRNDTFLETNITVPIEKNKERENEREDRKKVEVEDIEIALTNNERETLMEEFGNVTLKTKEAIQRDDFIRVRYELGEYWVEYTYSLGLDDETLKEFMREDRVKWLKDIAKRISFSEGSNESVKEEFLNEYSF